MQLGEKQLLKVVKKVEFGVYLGEEDSEERVLLPIKQRTSGNTGTDCKASGERSDQDRCISGLGIGKRSVSAV